MMHRKPGVDSNQNSVKLTQRQEVAVEVQERTASLFKFGLNLSLEPFITLTSSIGI